MEASPRSAGRPTDYTPELGQSIADRLVTHTLVEICREDQYLPCRQTIQRWIRDNEEFATLCARARQEHAHYLIEQAELTARECSEDDAKSAQVKIGFAQWFAARVMSKTYGDRQQVEVTGDVVHKIIVEAPAIAPPRALPLPAFELGEGEEEEK